MKFLGKDPNIIDAFYTATASGSIAAGKPVIVTGPGAPTLSSPVEFEAAGTYYYWGTFDSSNNKVVFTYQDNGNSDYGTAVVGTVSGNTVSFGTPVVFESASVEHIRCTFDTSNNKVVIAYKDGGNSNYGTAIVGTVSGTSISFGSAVVFVSYGIVDAAITFDSNENKVVICYPGSSSYGNAVIGTVSGTSISFGSPVVFESAQSTFIAATFDSSNNKVVLAYKDGGNSDQGTAIVGTVSGTSISFGSANVFESGGTHYIAIAFDSSANKVIIAYADAGDNYQGKAVSAEVSGTSINITGNVLTFNTGSSLATGLGLALAYDSAANKMGLAYKDRADGNATFAYLTVSGADLIRSDEAIIFSGNTGAGIYLAPAYDSVAERIVIAYNDQTDSDHGKAVVAINDTGGKVKAVGFGDASAGSESVFATASATLGTIVYDSSNDKIVVFFDRASQLRARVGTVSGDSISFGTEVTVVARSVAYVSATFDTSANKILVAYNNNSSNNDYGEIRAGTVSGTDISFGTAVTFNSNTTYEIGVAFDSNINRSLVAYRNSSNDGKAQAATISGTDVTMGNRSGFDNDTAYSIAVAYDANAQKHVIAYDEGFSSGKAIVATIDGTASAGTSPISYGSEATFQASGRPNFISIAYDSASTKVVITYRDEGNSNAGTSIVGTVSGTNITFGSEVVFTADINANSGVTSGATNGKITVAFSDADDSNHGKAIIGTVSGTSISFNTAIDFNSAETELYYQGVTYDAAADKAVIVYRDSGNSSYGTAATFNYGAPNLTSENYIGITDQAYTDGQDATVAVVGCIDRNQTSLTAGQQYFIQNDGTLSTTAGSPSVLAGTAISATELVVKE